MTDDVRLRWATQNRSRASRVRRGGQRVLASVALRHEALNVWSDGDALIASSTSLQPPRRPRGHRSVLQRVPAPDGLVAEYRSYIDATPVYSYAVVSVLTSSSSCARSASPARGRDRKPCPEDTAEDGTT